MNNVIKVTRSKFKNQKVNLLFCFYSFNDRQNFYTAQLFTKQEWTFVNLFSNTI